MLESGYMVDMTDMNKKASPRSGCMAFGKLYSSVRLFVF